MILVSKCQHGTANYVKAGSRNAIAFYKFSDFGQKCSVYCFF